MRPAQSSSASARYQACAPKALSRQRPYDCQVAVIGAGPYGLAVVAHLRHAGVDVRCFGEPMATWERHMPAGMVLRSPRRATHIPDPRGELTLHHYDGARGVQGDPKKPVPLADFVAYGRWFQEQVAPDVDRRTVMGVQACDGGLFRLVLDDGDSLIAGRVVVAAGLPPLAYRPPAFRGLPPSLVTHASEHRDLSRFAGQRVLVIGSGQSALESAALLAEGGADVEVLVRRPHLHWRRRWFRTHGRVVIPLGRIAYGPSAVGPTGISWIAETPDLFRGLRPGLQRLVLEKCLRPEPDLELRERLSGVRITEGQTVSSGVPVNSHLRVTLNHGGERDVDHALLATGYQVDLAQYRFVDPDLLSRLETAAGHPVLRAGLESSVHGLHVVGAPAARSFGPLMSFIAGARYAAQAVTRHVVHVR